MSTLQKGPDICNGKGNFKLTVNEADQMFFPVSDFSCKKSVSTILYNQHICIVFFTSKTDISRKEEENLLRKTANSQKISSRRLI